MVLRKLERKGRDKGDRDSGVSHFIKNVDIIECVNRKEKQKATKRY